MSFSVNGADATLSDIQRLNAWRVVKEKEWATEGSKLKLKYPTRPVFNSWMDKQCAKSLAIKQTNNEAKINQTPVARSSVSDPGTDSTVTQPQAESTDDWGLRHQSIVDAAASWIQRLDIDQRLPAADIDISGILDSIAMSVSRVMEQKGLDQLDDDCHKFIQKCVQQKITPTLDRLSQQLRFEKRERVVCNIRSDLLGELYSSPRTWCTGTIQQLNKPDQKQKVIVPYVVKLDPPIDRTISVPFDSNAVVRVEACFRESADDRLDCGTLYCLPQIKSKAKRFAVGDRVVCSVENSVEDSAVTGVEWAAGTVTEVEISMEQAAEEQLPEGFSG